MGSRGAWPRLAGKPRGGNRGGIKRGGSVFGDLTAAGRQSGIANEGHPRRADRGAAGVSGSDFAGRLRFIYQILIRYSVLRCGLGNIFCKKQPGLK